MPSYNEEDSLKVILPEVISHCEMKGYELVVVDDGSSDNTQQILYILEEKSKALKVVTHKMNKGYGAAIKSGIKQASTDYVVTMDADGQHRLEDIDKLFAEILSADADMIIGSRLGQKSASRVRGFGKWVIRSIARILMPLEIKDLNSGMKIYNTSLAKEYLSLCPDSMSYSDTIALVFVNYKHRVLETPISIRERNSGRSAVGLNTAFETLLAIINIVMLFNPLKVFLPCALFILFVSLLWGLPIVLKGNGVSVGTLLGITLSIFLFFLGLIAEQISILRKRKYG